MIRVINDSNRTQPGRMASSYAAWLGKALDSTSQTTDSDTTIFVSHLPVAEATKACPPGAHLLLSLQEDGHRQSAQKNPICLPFGSRRSYKFAAPLAFRLAKQLGVGIVAVHTTYRKNGLSSETPEDHFTPETQESLKLLRQMAAEFGVPLTLDVQMASEIPGFVVRAAIIADCGLIVMERGRVLYGSNAELVAAGTPIPILIVNNDGKAAQ